MSVKTSPMLPTMTDPIAADWPPFELDQPSNGAPLATASALSERLGQLDVADIDPAWLPEMAAAATELATLADVSLHVGHDDPPVALLRMIARATLARPDAAGPHTNRLYELLS